jgi:hypothetical protein
MPPETKYILISIGRRIQFPEICLLCGRAVERSEAAMQIDVFESFGIVLQIEHLIIRSRTVDFLIIITSQIEIPKYIISENT